MSTALTDPTKQAFDGKQLQMITDTIMMGADAQEVAFFAEVCKRANLDPFRKQIHAVKRWNSDLKRMVWSYQTGIDGFRAIANRTGTYAGSDEPVFDPQDESAPHPRKASVTVWKLVAGQRVPFSASARWSEYVQTKKDGAPNAMWNKMPYGQLAKCAEALALRKAFPEELSGLHTDEEMEQAESEGPRKTASSFDLERRNFQKEEPPAEPQPQPQAQEPAPVEVEAEVTTDEPALMPVPEPLQEYVNGGWKPVELEGKPLGKLKVSELRSLRIDSPPGFQAQLTATYIDEIRAVFAKAGKSEEEFSEIAEAEKVVPFAVELWTDLELYPDLLKLAKQL